MFPNVKFFNPAIGSDTHIFKVINKDGYNTYEILDIEIYLKAQEKGIRTDRSGGHHWNNNLLGKLMPIGTDMVIGVTLWVRSQQPLIIGKFYDGSFDKDPTKPDKLPPNFKVKKMMDVPKQYAGRV